MDGVDRQKRNGDFNGFVRFVYSLQIDAAAVAIGIGFGISHRYIE